MPKDPRNTPTNEIHELMLNGDTVVRSPTGRIIRVIKASEKGKTNET